MANEHLPDIDPALQPVPSAFEFDLRTALRAVHLVRARIPEDGFTVRTLGAERTGHAVLIDKSGLFLTIGYLIVEAESVWLIDAEGCAVEATVVGVDNESGLGLLQMLGRPSAVPLPIGKAADLRVGDRAVVAGYGGCKQAVDVEVTGLREFAGYWEYLLERAIFTSPPHPFWGGAALIGRDGTLRGIGSLFVQEGGDDDGADDDDDDAPRDGILSVPHDGNMIVPVDLLTDIKDDLMAHGQRTAPPRPWLGIFSAEASGKVVIAGIWEGGPAARAGVETGDLLLEVGGMPVGNLAAVYRAVWALGRAGVPVPLTLYRDRRIVELTVESANRADFYKRPGLH